MGETPEVLFSVFGLDVTGAVATSWGIIAVLALLSFLATRRMKPVPGPLQNVTELALGKLLGLFSGILGPTNARRCFPFLGTLFIYIIVSNYVGLLPGAGVIRGFEAPTSSLSVTAALGAAAFFATHYYGIREHGAGYFRRFVSPFALMLPLLLLDEFIKPLSLSLRLYGNIFGEETVVHQVFNLMPLLAPVVIQVLSLLFCFLQALVFTMLTAIYLSGALGEGH